MAIVKVKTKLKKLAFSLRKIIERMNAKMMDVERSARTTEVASWVNAQIAIA